MWAADVHWGVHGCRLLKDEEGSDCRRAAVMLFDADEADRGIPACLECAELVLEWIELRATSTPERLAIFGPAPLVAQW